MRKYISYILATALLFVCCAKTEVGLDESEVLVVSTNNIELDCDANEVTVLVNSLSSYSVSCDVGWREWVTASAMKGASGKTKIKFSFAQNNTISPRNATITIENSTYGVSETISVSQEAGAPFIRSSVTEISADVERFTTKIDVDSNIDYTISSSEKWCHLNRTSGKSGKTTLDITIDVNTDTLSRKATITLENKEHKITKTVSVSQGAFNPVVTVETERLEFAAEGGEKYVEINANCDYNATTDADWLTVEQTSTGIKVTALSYVEVTERTADIALTSGKYGLLTTIKVTQGAFVPILTISTDNLTLDVEGDKCEVSVTSNIDFMVRTDVDWLTIQKSATVVKVTALSNDEERVRTAKVEFYSEKYNICRTVKVSQGAFEVLFAVEPTTMSFTSGGGTRSVTITANIDYVVTKTADWLTVEQTSTGLNITALPNEEEQSRIAEINITNAKYSRTQTIKVTQVAFVPVLTVESTNLQFSVEGGLKSVAMTSNLDYQVTKTADWLTVEKSGSGITISASAYTGVTKRTASVVVSNEKYALSKTVNVIQIGINDLITSEPNRVLVYTSSNNSVVTPYMTSSFDATIVYNCYLDGCGCIIFDKPITSIGDSAFYDRDGLTSITIPNSVTSIGDFTFFYCTSLTSITIPNSVTSIGEDAFYHCDGLTSITIPNSVTSIGKEAFMHCYGLTSITIPNSVTKIGDSAFSYCTSLTSITIPNSVTSIGHRAFVYCSKLKEFKGKFASSDGRCLIVNGVLNSFAPAGLTEYAIPNSVTSIGYQAFCNCDGLTRVTIPNSITSIGDFAFYNCSGLTSVYCRATTPPTLVGGSVFDNNGSGRKIYVLTASVNAYKSASYWREYASSIVGYNFELGIEVACEIRYTSSNGTIVNPYTSSPFDANIISNTYKDGYGVIELDNEITSIGNQAFASCSSLTSITIPNSVTSIGGGAFYSCDGLTSITIPNSVTSIGDSAFYNCDGLTSITIPNSVTSIGLNPFQCCDKLKEFNGNFASSDGRCLIVEGVLNSFAPSGLTTYTIPNSVTKIGNAAFLDCNGLTRVTIPNSVTSIGGGAFYSCDDLTSVYCKATTPPTLGNSYVFDYNSSSRKIYVPRASEGAYRWASDWIEYSSSIVGYDF